MNHIKILPLPLKPIIKENWLTNGETYSQEVHLGKEDNPDNWYEITQEEKELRENRINEVIF